MTVINEHGGWRLLKDEEGRLWMQPPDNLPPIPYWVSDTCNLKGLERSETKR